MIIDVSNTHPITATRLRASKADALYCKATEGDNFRDATLAAHRAMAKSVGIPFGSYLFLHPASQGNEAGLYLSYAKPRTGDLQPAIDAETRDGASFAAVAARVDSCAKELEASGYHPLLYSYTGFLQGILAAEPRLKRLRVWQASYTAKRPAVGHSVSVVAWQFTDAYPVAGEGFDASRLYVPLSSLLI